VTWLIKHHPPDHRAHPSCTAAPVNPSLKIKNAYIFIKKKQNTTPQAHGIAHYFKHRAVIRTSEGLGNEKKNSRRNQDKLGPGGDGSHAA
jgi:hypothetical protein